MALWEEIKNDAWGLYESIRVRQGEDSVMAYGCRPKAIWHEINHFKPIKYLQSVERGCTVK